VRYWPDYGVTLYADGRGITNVAETSTGDFIIREFDVDEDPVSLFITVNLTYRSTQRS